MMYTIGGELYHHGVMGQKWGKRNGPPYPLKPEAHSDREKKFGYKKSIGGVRNEAAYEKNRKKVNRVEKKTANTQGGYKEERSMHKALKKGNAREEILKQLDPNTKREIADLRDKFEKASQEQEAAQQKILESLNKYNDDSHITQKMWDEMDRTDEAANKAYEDLNKKMDSVSSKLLGKRAKKDIKTGSGKKKADAALWDYLADIDSNDLRSSKKTANTQGAARDVPSEKKGMTDKQKKIAKGVAIGVGVAVATVAAVYVYKKYGKGALKSLAAKKAMTSTVKSSASNISTGKQYVGKVVDAAKKAPELKFDSPKTSTEISGKQYKKAYNKFVEKYMEQHLGSSAKSKIANSKVVTKLNQAKKTVSNAANQVSQSTAAAGQAASKTHLEVPKATAQKAAEAKAAITLKFSEQAQDSAEVNRKIIENNKRLQQAVSKTVMSQQSYIDEGEDLVAQMLKKNAKKLGM